VRARTHTHQVLGTDDFYRYLNKYGLELDPQLEALIGRHSRKPWTKFVNAENQHLVGGADEGGGWGVRREG
jgi:hypothetical protein